MTARPSAKIAATANGRQVSDAIRILDENTLIEATPTAANDATMPLVKFAYDSSYLYVQLTTGVWRRVAHATW